jgi:hypothetical protein
LAPTGGRWSSWCRWALWVSASYKTSRISTERNTRLYTPFFHTD